MDVSRPTRRTAPDIAAEFVERDVDVKEFFQGRAAIIEYDVGLSRRQAEANAMVEKRECVKARDQGRDDELRQSVSR